MNLQENITCITFPEKIIIKELQSVYSSLK